MCNLCCRYCSPCLYYVWLPRRTLHQCCNCYSLRVGAVMFAILFIVLDILFLAGALRIALVVPQESIKEPNDPGRKPLYNGLVKPLYNGAYIFYYIIAALFFLWTILDILLLIGAIAGSLVLLSAWILLSLERFIHVLLDVVAIIVGASFSIVLQDGQQDYKEPLLLVTFHFASLLLLILLTYPRCVVNSLAYSLNPCENDLARSDKCIDKQVSACSEDLNRGTWGDSCGAGPSHRPRGYGADCEGGGIVFPLHTPHTCSCNPCDGSCVDDCGAPSQSQCKRGHHITQENCERGSSWGHGRTCDEGGTYGRDFSCNRINDPPFNIRSPPSSCVGIRQDNPPASECRRDRYQSFEEYSSCPQPDYEIRPRSSRPPASYSYLDYECRQYPAYPEPDYDDYQCMRDAHTSYSPPQYDDFCSYPPYSRTDYRDRNHSYPPGPSSNYDHCYAPYPQRGYEERKWNYPLNEHDCDDSIGRGRPYPSYSRPYSESARSVHFNKARPRH